MHLNPQNEFLKKLSNTSQISLEEGMAENILAIKTGYCRRQKWRFGGRGGGDY